MTLAEGEWLGSSCSRDGKGMGKVSVEEDMGEADFELNFSPS